MDSDKFFDDDGNIIPWDDVKSSYIETILNTFGSTHKASKESGFPRSTLFKILSERKD